MTGTDYMVTDFVDSFFLFWELKHIPPKIIKMELKMVAESTGWKKIYIELQNFRVI